MKKTMWLSHSILVCGSLVLLNGCGLTGPESPSSSTNRFGDAAPAGFHESSTNDNAEAAPNFRQGATPSGLSTYDNYDQPGALPPNATGGTNGGRGGLDNQRVQ